jgi:putative transposase
MSCKGFDGLHSQSAQAGADSFSERLQSWRNKRRSGDYDGLRFPDKQKRYFKVQWKSSAIKLLWRRGAAAREWSWKRSGTH